MEQLKKRGKALLIWMLAVAFALAGTAVSFGTDDTGGEEYLIILQSGQLTGQYLHAAPCPEGSQSAQYNEGHVLGVYKSTNGKLTQMIGEKAINNENARTLAGNGITSVNIEDVGSPTGATVYCLAASGSGSYIEFKGVEQPKAVGSEVPLYYTENPSNEEKSATRYQEATYFKVENVADITAANIVIGPASGTSANMYYDFSANAWKSGVAGTKVETSLLKNSINQKAVATTAQNVGFGYVLTFEQPAVAINVQTEKRYSTLQKALDEAEDQQTVKLLMDLKENVTFNGANEKTVTLDLNDKVLTADPDKTIITIANGTLTLVDDATSKTTRKYKLNSDGVADLADDGDKSFNGGCVYGARDTEASGNAHGINVQSQGNLIMNSGTVIGNQSGSEGGGILVSGYRGYSGDPDDNVSFTMNGGNILGNRSEFGGGISCRGNAGLATTTINGGTISYNWGEQHSGAINVGNNTIITGGTITENHVEYENRSPMGGAIEFGYEAPSSQLTISGKPVIQNNTRTTSEGITEESNITLAGYSTYGSQYAHNQFTLGDLLDAAKIGISIFESNEKSLGVFTVGSTLDNSTNAFEKGLFTSDHGFYVKVHISSDDLNDQMELADPGFTVTGPEDITVNIGSTGTLSVTAEPKEGHTGQMEYQWYEVGEEGSTPIEGATSSTLTVGDGLVAGSYKYYCEVKFTPTGETSSISIDSRVATVTVPDSVPVEIGAFDKDVAFTGKPITIPVDGMFLIPKTAGDATYTVTPGTGAGNYDPETGKLTVTKVGTFNVKVNTAPTDTHGAGEAEATLTVVKGTLQPKVNLESWTYGDEANKPSVEGNAGEGKVTYTYAPIGSDGFVEEVPTEAGRYTVKASIAATEDYEAAEATADFTIRQKVVSLEWKGTSLTYNGEEQGPTATVANLVGEDTCAVTVKGKETNAGEYVAKATRLSNDNYRLLPDAVTQTFIISKAEVALKVSMDNWTYGETAKDAVVTGQPKGAIPTIEYKVFDAKDSTYSETKPTQAGKYKVRATLEATDNYKAAVATDNFEIAPKPVELAWEPENGEFIYDGTEKCPTATVTNLEEGDRCTVIVTGAATSVGKHTAGALMLTNSNYELPKDKAPIKPFEILAAKPELTVTMASWQYGSKASIPSVEGNTGGGNVTYLYTVKGEEDWTDVKPSDAGEYTVKATVAATAGYEGASATADFTITPITASIEWENIAFVYDGEAHVPSARVGNAVKGDRCRVTVEGAQTKASEEPYTATATELSSSNYVLPDPRPTQPFTISKGTLTPAVTIAGWTYGDEPNEPSVEGNIGGGEVTYTYAPVGSDGFVEEVPTEAGVYVVKASIAETEEGYLPAEVTSEFVISPKTASLAWRGVWNTYNGSEQIPTATVDNLVGDDKCEVKVEGSGKEAGEYVAKAVELSNRNYELPQTVNQTYIIGKASIDYASEGYAAVRDDKDHGITVQVNAPENAIVKYGTEKGKYTLDESPKYKAEGSHTVYYQITANNYRTVEGKETVLIMSKSAAEESGPDVITGDSKNRFAPLKARSEQQTKRSITVNWNYVTGATKYVVYGNLCNSKGHAYYLKKLGVSTSNSFKVTNMAGKKLDKGRMHKFMVIAMDENDKIIEKSATIHVVTKGSKWKNYKGIKLINPKNGKCTLKAGTTKKIKAKAKGKHVKKHAGLRYASSNPAIATVSAKGVIKAKTTGKCVVYVFTQNGKYRSISVTVK